MYSFKIVIYFFILFFANHKLLVCVSGNYFFLRSNASIPEFPESPLELEGEEFTTTTENEEIATTESESIVERAEDLSVHLNKPYCKCVAWSYCTSPNKRIERAINKPLCPNRDQVMCCRTQGVGCGVPANFPYFKPLPIFGEANYGDFPWSALILDNTNKYIYGQGIIISWNVIITAARNLVPYMNSNRIRGTNFKVRLGEWDLNNEVEPFPVQDFSVTEVIVHPQFDTRTFQNDIAILRVNSSIDLNSNPNIRSVCLVRSQEEQLAFKGAKCITSGWGMKAQRVVNNGPFLLKEVDMEILDGSICQYALRKVVGDPNYFLDTKSFLCAGGEEGKGICKGDEGGALVCQDRRDSRYKVVGISSWGTTCGESGFPGIFTNLASYYDWIKSVDPNIGQY